MEKIESYVSDRLKQTMAEIEIVDKRIVDNFKGVKEKLNAVKEGKANADYSFDKAKPLLSDARDSHYEAEMLNQHMRNLIQKAKELKTLADVFEMSVGLTEQQEQGLSFIMKEVKPYFMLEGEELKLVDSEIIENLKKAVDLKMSEEDLLRTFNSI